MSPADWADEWKATIVDLLPSTKVRDLGYLERYVLPRFGNMELGRIDHMAVRAWVAELSASGLSPATTTKAVQILSKMMTAAVQAGLWRKSPCDGVQLPRIERVEMPTAGCGPVSASGFGPGGSTRCAAPSPLPRRWSTSADIPTSGPPRDQKAPPSDQGEQGRVSARGLEPPTSAV